MEKINKLLKALGFSAKEKSKNIFIKKYLDYSIEVDFENEKINYGKKIKCDSKTTQNFSQEENFVVLECIDRLLTKGYKPENIILEKTYPSGHGTSGRLDICINKDDGSEYLLIECKTWGKEFDKELLNMKKNGGQLFTYFKFSNKADVITLYTSKLEKDEIIYKNEIVKIEDGYRLGDVKDFYTRWNKLTKDNGIFEEWIKPYDFKSRALTLEDLKEIKPEDSSLIFNQFLEILRHNVVSDKGNAFNKIFTLFLCKIYDEWAHEENEERKKEELAFQWLEGEDHRSFQIRLTDLYKKGMYEFLEKDVTDFSEREIRNKFIDIDEKYQDKILEMFEDIRLEKNNEFAIKDVYDKASFNDNAIVVKEVVELLQKYKLRYTKKQQYLSDFFELLLTTGLKQESGQFFTPVPVAQFVIKSLPLDVIIENKMKNATLKGDNMLPYVIDYASGSGHFLTEAMHEMQNIIKYKLEKNYNKTVGNKIKTWQEDHFAWALDYVYGIEKDYRLVKVGKVGCYLHGDGLANVIHSDGLAKFGYEDYKGKLMPTDKEFSKDNKQFDIVISNPPYSVSGFKNSSSKYYNENDFDLYKYLTDTSSEIECLFIERTKQLLTDGGVAGIILPSSILSNTGIYSKTREIILDYFDIVGITELGSNTFMATNTSTVVLFLRRRENYQVSKLKKYVVDFFENFSDVTINNIQNPVAKYVSHVWEGISFEDYVSLLKKKPNEKVSEHEIYKEYKNKIKCKNEKEFFEIVLKKEEEKLYYFIVTYPQKVVLIKSGEKDAEKRFLGYEFSNRRGSEGIHPIQKGKLIEECTKLFDPNNFENPTKASSYIYKAFKGDFEFSIDDEMKENISRHNLVDMLTFDRIDFEKTISLSVKKKIKLESKWEIVKISEVSKEIINGSTPSKNEYKFWEKEEIKWLTIPDLNSDSLKVSETKNFVSKVALDKKKIRLVPKNSVLISCTATVGKVGVNTEELSTNQQINSIICNEKILPMYLGNYLRIYGEKLKELTSNSGVQHVNLTMLNSFQIPLPPKDIQQKIVDEIEVLEKKEEKAKNEIENLKNKIEIILENAQEKYSKNKIEDLFTLEYGKSLPESSRKAGIYPVVGSNGIVGYHDEFLVEAPTIVVGRKGSVGKINLINENCTPIDTTFFVKIKENSEIEFNYLSYILKFSESKFTELNTGSGPGGLNRNNAYQIKIPVPPISEQKKIVSEIEKIEEKIEKLEAEIKNIPEQKEIILKKYL